MQQDKYKKAYTALIENRRLRPCSTELAAFESMGKPLWRFFRIDCELFLRNMTALKKKIAATGEPDVQEAVALSNHKHTALGTVDQLEMVIQESKRALGKVFVPQKLYLEIIRQSVHLLENARTKQKVTE